MDMKRRPENIQARRESSYLGGGNGVYVEALYAGYLEDPSSVDPKWRAYFDSLQDGAVPHASAAPKATETPRTGPEPIVPPESSPIYLSPDGAKKQAAVLRLINVYRVRGHQHADVDPVNLLVRQEVPDLELSFHGLGEQDLNSLFNTGSFVAPDQLSLREIVDLAQTVYIGCIGSEYMHITDTAQKRWIQKRLEGTRAQPGFTPEFRRQILERIMAAEGLERYLHTKYVGQKRFSLEGAESLIPLLDELVRRAGSRKVKEIVLGMTHRGRINVLVNILGKSTGELFLEFEGKYDSAKSNGTGDVKYHQGFSSDINTPGGPVHLALSFNPSHLESIDPVVEGSVRARQKRRDDSSGAQVLPVLVHGDAAFAGQGVVMETFNMSQARGYATGGTVHIVVNNQIGFTTSHPYDARSTAYCTDVAKMVQAPIFHVNGDDPEAVVFVTQLALDFRMEFRKDVVIDLVCYRRHGHNEADEPAVTQPMMYRKIKDHPMLRSSYAERLVAEQVITPKHADAMVDEYRTALDEGRMVARNILTEIKKMFDVDWSPYHDVAWSRPTDTSVPVTEIQALSEKINKIPEGFELHPRVAKIVDDRRKMAAGAKAVDWGFAENLAYATLLQEGYTVRLAGQDSGRGTFFHRHAVLHNQKDGSSYIPLKNIHAGKPRFTIIDSLLSEEAALGYEYGYATTEPNALVIWEAQFGDFANGAQVIIDQFISSGEAKWSRLCGLTLFLPHGYEGQGAEHSSARLERYLQLCAEHNMQVCVPTTPAQMFHMLRRQMIRPFRHPLVVLTPKSLLRHKLATSTLDELSQGAFAPVIGDSEPLDSSDVERVILCSGKVYYDLLEGRRARQKNDTTILRIEQLHPFPRVLLREEMQRFGNAKQIIWCQEEPKNQGAWYQIQHHLKECINSKQTLGYAGRPASASPAVGYLNLHIQQQEALLENAFTRLDQQ
ncbi:MAG: 2-oxoglutarate dehydrogenase E1 component [Gammaproteobacteria bacterium]